MKIEHIEKANILEICVFINWNERRNLVITYVGKFSSEKN
jgi:hypothetical protein